MTEPAAMRLDKREAESFQDVIMIPREGNRDGL
jgi:hypothetical protein